jgi:hypothetical protein
MRRVGAIVLALATTAGCMIGPSYRQPETPTAPSWSSTDDARVVQRWASR